MKNLKKKGFTIVELVIVIAVVAVLAAVLIPTFSNLIKKANESVDIQLVRNMNVILEQDEALNGKPADIEKVKDILAKNGISNPTPAYSESAFAWDSEENVIVLVNKETKKGVFPKEYEDVVFGAAWKLLAGTINVTLEDLGVDSLAEALEKVELGQTIVLSSDQTLNATTLPKNVSIDLDGNKLTLPNGLSMEPNSVVEISNGNIEGAQITTDNGATLILKDVDLKSTDGLAIYPYGRSPRLDISGGSIIANYAIGTAYSDKNCRDIIVNIHGTQIGSSEEACEVGISMITSGDITISDCTIYATEKAVYNRCGNITIKDTEINYKPANDFEDTYLNHVYGGQPNPSFASTYPTPLTPDTPEGLHPKGQHWDGGSDSVSAPIVVGDFHAKHYSYDANCTLINVTVNCDNNTYPDVYLSQENYDLILTGTSTVIPGTEQIVKTTLTCDDSIYWYVNPNKNTTFKDSCTGEYEVFANYGGFIYSNSGYGGTALLYVDNVFVNGVEQAPGSTSLNPVPAN